MSENYIVINGKKAELTPEQLKALGLEREIKNPFEREEGQKFYFIDKAGDVSSMVDECWCLDNELFEVANYCTDREMMQQQAYRETLNRLLWRYSMEHKGNEIEWGFNSDAKWGILYRHDEERFSVTSKTFYQWTGAVFFTTKEIAENAIKEIIEPFMKEHPDFKL